MTRRHFLASAALLSSCTRLNRHDLVMALGWVPNVEYADLWVAIEKGYFARQHVSLKIWPGGPNAPQPVVEVAARQAHLGESDWLPLLDAVLRGNDLVIIASTFPIHPAGLLSLPKRPIRTPADLVNARFLVQGPAERTAVDAMFKLNHLPPSYQLIPVGYSPEALLNGAGDAYYCFITNQPLMLEDMGMRPNQDFIVTRLDQLGYRLPSTLIFAERKTILERRSELVRFLAGRLQGQAENARNPSYGAQLAVDKFGADLGLTMKHELRTNLLQLPLYQTPGSIGPYWVSDSDLRDHMYGVAKASGRTNLPDPSSIMDMSLLQEAYKLT